MFIDKKEPSLLIRTIRTRLGMTQEKFAARLGVTFTSVNRWENGRTKPSPLALRQIEDIVKSMGDNGKDLLNEFFVSTD